MLNNADLKRFVDNLQHSDRCVENANKMVQLAVHPPLLVEQRKFDLRIYAYIASNAPIAAFVHPFFVVRLAGKRYSTNGDNPNVLTLEPGSKAALEDQLSPEDLMRRLGKDTAWLKAFRKKVSVWTARVMGVVCAKLSPQPGRFSLLGLDALVDANADLWLGEINLSPQLNVQNREQWRLDAQLELTTEIVETQLALSKARHALGNPQSTDFSLIDALLSSSRKFEPVLLERETGLWSSADEHGHNARDAKEL